MVKQARGLKPVFLAMTMMVPLAVLPGCAAIYDPQGFSAALAQADNGQEAADAALAALARGDYAEAEGHVTQALDRDPQNPYALLAAGVLFHNTGRPTRARQMYEEILATNTVAEVSGPWWGSRPRPVMEVAADNLRALGGAGLPVMMGEGEAGVSPHSPPLPPPGVAGAEEQRFTVLQRLRSEGLITAEEYSRRRAANLGALLPLSEQPPALGLDEAGPQAEQVVRRLRALREAYETRNLTAAQHAAERTAILDGLLPAAPRTRMTPVLPPADVMGAAAMLGRLQRLREAGLISEAEMNRERAAIEHAMRSGGSSAAVRTPTPETATAPPTPQPKPTPAAPSGDLVSSSGNPAAMLRTGRTPLEVVASPPPAEASGESQGQGENPPEEEMTDAAVLSGRVAPAPLIPPAPPPEEEEEKEEEAAADPAAAPPAARTEASGGGPVFVHLASFRSPDAARQGWADLQRRFPALQQLSLQVTEIDLSGRGVFHRVNAGPLADRAAADALCLQLRGQYCRPIFPNSQ